MPEPTLDQVRRALEVERRIELGHRSKICVLLQRVHDSGRMESDGLKATHVRHEGAAFQDCQHDVCKDTMKYLAETADETKAAMAPLSDGVARYGQVTY